MNSGAPKVLAIPAPHVTPVVLLLNEHHMEIVLDTSIWLLGKGDHKAFLVIFLSAFYPRDCNDIPSGPPLSGVYTIYPSLPESSKHFDVYCDMDTDGGKWTVSMSVKSINRNITRKFSLKVGKVSTS